MRKIFRATTFIFRVALMGLIIVGGFVVNCVWLMACAIGGSK